MLSGRAVEEQQVGKIEKPGADLLRVAGTAERLNQRRKLRLIRCPLPLARFPGFPASPLTAATAG